MKLDRILKFVNLLTFLTAVTGIYGVNYSFRSEREIFQRIGDILFIIFLYTILGGITWQTGKWLFKKNCQIKGWALVAFWVWLFFIYAIMFSVGLSSIGYMTLG